MDAAKRTRQLKLSGDSHTAYPPTFYPALGVLAVVTALGSFSSAYAASGGEPIGSGVEQSEIRFEEPVRVSPVSYPYALSQVHQGIVSIQEDNQLGFGLLSNDGDNEFENNSDVADKDIDDGGSAFRDRLKSGTQRNLMDQDESPDRQPEVVNGRFALPSLAAASTNTSEVGNGKTPAGFRADATSPIAPVPESGIDRFGDWAWSLRTWAAPNTFSNPRYFEDRMLERHGHERCPHWTPLFAGARFFATVPMLPYLATVDRPTDCEYTLGYYRTGNCAPAYLQRPPWERRAVVAEATAITAGVFIIP